MPYREEPELSSFTPGCLEQEIPRNPARTFSRNLSISQLAQFFSEQRLHPDGLSDARSEPAVAMALVDGVQRLDSYVGTTSSGGGGRRSQRQQGVKMLCDPSHLKNIQEMVERMVQSEDQCCVSPPRLSMAQTPDPRDDEGYNSVEEKAKVRREGSASSLSDASFCSLDGRQKRSCGTRTGASVSKKVRFGEGKSRKSASRGSV